MGRRAADTEVRLGGGRRGGDDGGRLGGGLATGILMVMWAAGGSEGVIFFLMIGCGAAEGDGSTFRAFWRLTAGRR